jgi:hypothetical protein
MFLGTGSFPVVLPRHLAGRPRKPGDGKWAAIMTRPRPKRSAQYVLWRLTRSRALALPQSNASHLWKL